MIRHTVERKIAAGFAVGLLILGIVGTAAGLAGMIATWSAGPEFGPKWYPIALTVLAIPSVWVGGRVWARMKVEA